MAADTMSRDEWLRVRECVEKASRVNPDSPHRRELRRILKRHDLEIATAALRGQDGKGLRL